MSPREKSSLSPFFWVLVLFVSACTCDPSRCLPETCSGCCTANDLCVVGGPGASCGLNGSACVDCGASACVGGTCVNQTCTPGSCDPEKVCDLDAGRCIARPACLADAGCPPGLGCVRELQLCATRCASSDDCPTSGKNCSFSTCRCSSTSICRAGLADAGSLACDPVGKLCR